MLKTPTDEIPTTMFGSEELRQFAKDMVTTMKKAHGVGLAAPQVGKNWRMAVIHKQADASLRADLLLINPRISRATGETVRDEEGCLSIPGVFGIVPRPDQVLVHAYDLEGNRFAVEAYGLFARVLQHEIDHLQGILFLERAEKITQGERLL